MNSLIPEEGSVWAFDLGKASIGEAVRVGERFVHKASLLIPAEFAETKTAAVRRRMWRTRLAHKARENWLDSVMRYAGVEVLPGRQVGKVDESGVAIPPTEWKTKKGKWAQMAKGDYRMEREFPPSHMGKDKEGKPKKIFYRDGRAKDGAPAQSDKDFNICYNSALLRIKLLVGERLEAWQIYKALHSAVQKRGYGRVPWATRELKRTGRTENELEQELAKKDPEYKAAVEAWGRFKQEFPDPCFHFPCYYDAAKMGLWKPGVFNQRINCHAMSTRRVRFDRQDVEKEIAALALQAANQLPQIHKAFETIKTNGWTQGGKQFPVAAKTFGEFLIHGPAGTPPADATDDFGRYLSFREKQAIHSGSADDWMGATAQKVPRFDNRIVNDCALLEGLQVCGVAIRYDAEKKQPYPDSLLASEVTFLMKLKNTLVSKPDGHRKLTVKEIQTIFEAVSADALAVSPEDKNWAKKVAEKYALTKAAWGGKKGVKELGLRPLTGHEIIKPPKLEGRSRFSRPALRLLRALILGGRAPGDFRKRLLAREPVALASIGMDVLDSAPTRDVKGAKNFIKQARPWVLVQHLKFLQDLEKAGDTWENIHIPEQRLDALESRHTAEDGVLDKKTAIAELLGNINDPVVRHRLGVFAHRLQELQNAHGVPAAVVLEFVREDFMGDQAKRDLQKFQSEREKLRLEARENAAKLGAAEKSAALKYELGKAQGFVCLYCGQALAETALSDYDIEHIVPRSQGGPDAMVNYVLAHRECNAQKDEQTPFQWKNGKEGWDGYETTVKLHAVALRNKKVQLLLREDAAELVQRYTALAETAWISKLAQTLVSLHFGWRNGIDFRENPPVKRVSVISGGLTGRVRRKYQLNSLLNPAPPGTTDLREWDANAEKNRDDDRHHALDAMIISFLPAWARDARKEHFFRFPESIHKNAKAFFEGEINQVMPRMIAYEKAALAETIYGARTTKSGLMIVQRVPLPDMAMKPIAPGKAKFDLAYLRKQITAIRDETTAARLRSFLETNPDENDWHRFCAEFQVPQRDGTPGSHPKNISVKVGLPDEYREMSKDGTGGWRKGLGSHKGQIIFRDEKGVLAVRPIFAHASVAAEKKSVEKMGGQAKFYGFFQSDCPVQTFNEIPAGSYSLVVRNEAKLKRRVPASAPLPACKLTLRTIITKGFVAELTLANNARVVARLDVWVEAGLTRIA